MSSTTMNSHLSEIAEEIVYEACRNHLPIDERRADQTRIAHQQTLRNCYEKFFLSYTHLRGVYGAISLEDNTFEQD